MEIGIIESALCTNSYKRGMGMDKSKERIRKLMSADVRMGEAYYLFSRRRGVKENELNVLYALDDGGAHTQQQIVRDWLMPKTTVNTTVKALVREGYATLLPQGGGRDKQIVLTEEGRKRAQEILRDVYAAERAAMERTCSRFSPEFVEAVGYFADCLLEELSQRGGQGAAGKGNEREEDAP